MADYVTAYDGAVAGFIADPSLCGRIGHDRVIWYLLQSASYGLQQGKPAATVWAIRADISATVKSFLEGFPDNASIGERKIIIVYGKPLPPRKGGGTLDRHYESRS